MSYNVLDKPKHVLTMSAEIKRKVIDGFRPISKIMNKGKNELFRYAILILPSNRDYMWPWSNVVNKLSCMPLLKSQGDVHICIIYIDMLSISLETWKWKEPFLTFCPKFCYHMEPKENKKFNKLLKFHLKIM